MKRFTFLFLLLGISIPMVFSQGQCNAAFTVVPDTANPCNFFFVNNSTGGTIPIYSWSFGDGSTSFQQSPSHSYSSNGSYTVILTMVDSSSACFSTFTRTVQVVGCGQSSCTASFAAFPDTSNSCTYHFINNSSGAPNLSYSWFFGNGNSSLQSSPSHTYTTNGTYTVTLVVSNASGCFDSTSQTITVIGCSSGTCTASLFATPDTANSCTYYFTSNATGSAPFSYRWNFGNGSSSTQANPSHTYSSNGTYTVSLTIVDANGCLATTTQTVVVSGCAAAPCNASFFAFPDSLNPCTFYFNNNSTPSTGLSYSWSFGDGNSSSFANPTHTYTSNGTYRVTLIISSPNGCFDSTSQTISVMGCTGGVCQAGFSATPGMANPCTYLFTDLSTSTGPVTSRNWDFGDGSSSSLPSPTHTYTANGTYTARLIITDMSGCTDTAFRTLVVTACGPSCRANFSVTPSMTDPCSFVFIDLSTSTGMIQSQDWAFGDGTTSSLPTPTHTYASNGSYTVRLVIADNMSCSDTVTQVVNVTGCQVNTCQAVFSYSQDMLDSCLFTFTNASTGTAPITYNWDFGDGNTATAQNPSHSFGSNGSFVVQLIMEDATSCRDTVSQSVQVRGCDTLACRASFRTRQDIANNRRIHFTDMSSGSPSVWLWNFGDGNTANVQHPTHTYNSYGSYTVSLTILNNTTNCGHSWEDTILVDNNMSTLPDVVIDARFYPSPVTDLGKLEVEIRQTNPIDWQIVDMMGRKVLEGESPRANSHQVEIDMHELSSGYYVIQVNAAGQQVYLSRFMKK